MPLEDAEQFTYDYWGSGMCNFCGKRNISFQFNGTMPENGPKILCEECKTDIKEGRI